MWMSAEDVATESLSALDRRQVIFVPGLKNRLVVATVARNTPRSLLHLLRSNRPPSADHK
ncbi:MAG: hypothetical protein GTN78_25575 [Gemmatimonadales bacterium]|nr:hypothetical protein [Gemmatimonadales bacterium]